MALELPANLEFHPGAPNIFLVRENLFVSSTSSISLLGIILIFTCTHISSTQQECLHLPKSPDYFIDILEGIAKPESGVNYKQIPVRWMVHNGYPVPRDMLQNTELQMDWDCPPVKTLHGESEAGSETESFAGYFDHFPWIRYITGERDLLDIKFTREKGIREVVGVNIIINKVLRENRKRVLLFLLFLRITIFEFTIREVQETIKREINWEGWGSSKHRESKGKWGGMAQEKVGRG
ncbi:hypothetical protein DKX38_000416 [Salix brachista]|uniref:ABC transporter family G domain-containing protein n=1 Tax=Salix brachista TaxID=2182728 RepID=A0A5N5P0W9_9ROSI|nr:hypothetical protein DKX38_000416 [Salix brachista]